MSDDQLFQAATTGDKQARLDLFERLRGPILGRKKDPVAKRWWVRMPDPQYFMEKNSTDWPWTGAGVVSATLLSVLWCSLVYLTTEPPARPKRWADASQEVRDHWRVARHFDKRQDWRKTIRNELNRAVKQLVASDSDYPGLGKRKQLEPRWSPRANREMMPGVDFDHQSDEETLFNIECSYDFTPEEFEFLKACVAAYQYEGLRKQRGIYAEAARRLGYGRKKKERLIEAVSAALQRRRI